MEYLEQIGAAQKALEASVANYIRACTALGAPPAVPVCDIKAVMQENSTFLQSIRSQLSYADVTWRRVQNRYAPVNRLVHEPELLADIFQLGIIDQISDRPIVDAAKSTVFRAILLSSVCSDWRRVILEKSSFWSLVPVRQSDKSKNITTLCMERVQDRPLDVLASAVLFSQAPWTGVQAIVPRIDRIRSLLIAANSTTQIHSIMKQILSQGSPGLLKDVSVCFLGDLDDPVHIFPDLPPTANLSEFTNQIVTLDLELCGLDWNRHTLHALEYLKLNSNGTLCGRGPPTDQLAHIITTCHNLRILELTRVDFDDTRPCARQITVQNLKTLRLHSLFFPVLRCILESLLPGPYNIELFLHAISLGVYAQDAGAFVEGVARLEPVLRRLYNITTLGLGDDDSLLEQEPAITRIMELLPNVTTLFLDQTRLKGELLSALTKVGRRSTSGRNTSPAAQIHVIRMRHVTITSADAFEAMVRSHPVEHIELQNCWLTQVGDSMGSRIVPSSPFYIQLSKIVPKVTCPGSGELGQLIWYD